MSTRISSIDSPSGLGSVTGVPHLPAGFTDTFTSRFVDANGIQLHVVIGGSGPALILIPGWPQTWYAWRALMPALAEHFTVIAPDIRGFGLSDKPDTGYDQITTGQDMLALMTELGHETFAVFAHDLGVWVAYGMATQAPERIVRMLITEAVIPGVNESFPLLGSQELNDFMWHFGFNRAGEINERMVEGREEIYFRHQFASKSSGPDVLPDYAVNHYIDLVKQSPHALRGTFAYYRAISSVIEYSEKTRDTKLTMPIHVIEGGAACNGLTFKDWNIISDGRATTEIIDGCGHFMMDERPEDLLRMALPFFEPYKQGK
ncbi:alpha/beta fold hydrolase [Gordonia sp. (in: high G+C Gram-positive bacteria)]|jgi:pimeloyl-ACP methyl ester carboxylesterase|uniref:alpha/beta fold hydrolase n=1 Tax=Gordonia sp. (in: high G+C Gram-positive bacteria) TaxID=84139 RepID=UPI0026023657|nr:alpha/beta hydrolase [Gordonia sp. (in: high G+C Gram-positive bacteria)]HMS73867.1 alpha/beta hydrolase [Gordonia sp. (in: high G+C Gram-positive bacteria)]HQV19127.1 alpha/beta hydrolase [Gordonia sp. (in: high G+C Gram-positive bacteria)]